MPTLTLIVLTVWLAAAVVCQVTGYRPARRPTPVASRRRAVRADVPHALYVYPHLFRPGGRYYGVSNDPAARHRRRLNDPRDRWWLVTSTGQMVIIAWYTNRAAAFAAERDAVRAAALRGEDIANHVHNPLRPRRARRRPVRH